MLFYIKNTRQLLSVESLEDVKPIIEGIPDPVILDVTFDDNRLNRFFLSVYTSGLVGTGKPINSKNWSNLNRIPNESDDDYLRRIFEWIANAVNQLTKKQRTKQMRNVVEWYLNS